MKTNIKNKYHIELKCLNEPIACKVANVAALCNSGKLPKDIPYINIEGLAFYAKVIRAEIGYKDVSINVIGEHQLTIDKGTKNLLFIEERMMHELVAEDEMDKLLD